jgi:hypothetical protein
MAIFLVRTMKRIIFHEARQSRTFCWPDDLNLNKALTSCKILPVLSVMYAKIVMQFVLVQGSMARCIITCCLDSASSNFPFRISLALALELEAIRSKSWTQ